MSIYCNNCGNEGHLYRQCRLPVLSYGVLLINPDNQILMIRRKDSLSYIEFLRGKYDLDNTSYIFDLINTCSTKERELLKNSTFDELWNGLWFSGKHKKKQTERMVKEYQTSLRKFEKLQQGFLYKCLEICTKFYPTPEWEFPKGRRSHRESNMKCAVREFEEETDLQPHEYILLNNVIPISEEYTGSNGVRYKHIYYYALYKGSVSNTLHINQDKYEQYSEIGDISWFSIQEASHQLRQEQSSKQDILVNIQQFIDNQTKDFRVKV